MNAQATELLRLAAEGRLDREQLNGALTQLAGDNPSLAPIVQLMLQRAGAAPGPTPDFGDLDERRARGRERLANLLGRLEVLERRLEHVARALGACACLGEDPLCERCQGDGAPGAYAVDRRLFAYFVQPAIDQPTVNAREKREDIQ